MKTMSLLGGVCLVMVLGACKTDHIRKFIPGTYVNSAGGKYSVADDTLVIVPAEGNNYRIERSTGFNRISEGVMGKREYEQESWNAVYDEGTKILTESRNGKLITFYPDTAFLKVGQRLYKKLADH